MAPSKEILAHLRRPTQDLRERSTVGSEDYGAVSAAAFAEGARRQNERTPVRRPHRLPIPRRCPPERYSEEVAEALYVAIPMNGGPSRAPAPRAFAAFEEIATRP